MANQDNQNNRRATVVLNADVRIANADQNVDVERVRASGARMMIYRRSGGRQEVRIIGSAVAELFPGDLAALAAADPFARVSVPQQFLQKPRQIVRPPGSRLLALSTLMFSKKANELVFGPIIADLRQEYFEALNRGERWRARFIQTRAAYNFLEAVLLQFSVSGLKRLWEFWTLTR